MVGKKRRHVRKSSAVSCIYHDEKRNAQYGKRGNLRTFHDTLRHNNKSRESDRQDEDHLVDRVPVFKSVCPCRKSQTSCCIGNGRDRSESRTHTDRKSYRFEDHLLLRDKCKSACDIDIEHQPYTDESLV